MRKLNVCDLSVLGVVKRFYLMMAVIIVVGFFEQFILAAILGFAIAVSFILGISFTPTAINRQVKIYPIKKKKETREAA